ncbi:hypothetical protein Sjap_019796 [Stephania japonica]|uniref:Secreted protein n=1 Tax=Stephania japonica TaxID=461633 RepID=A0AAP0F4Z3_9MAGN
MTLLVLLALPVVVDDDNGDGDGSIATGSLSSTLSLLNAFARLFSSSSNLCFFVKFNDLLVCRLRG